MKTDWCVLLASSLCQKLQCCPIEPAGLVYIVDTGILDLLQQSNGPRPWKQASMVVHRQAQAGQSGGAEG